MPAFKQKKFLIDTTVNFQRRIDFAEPLRSASIINNSTVTLNVNLGGGQTPESFELPATTAIDVQPWDLHYVTILSADFSVANTAPAGASFSMIWVESKQSLWNAIVQGALA